MQKVPAISAPLIRWYRQHRRDLPWRRRGHDAYAQLIAELMLQQTQVATVIGYYERFMVRFPTVHALAAADLDDVLALWSGLGYYRRARHLHAAARAIVSEHAGVLPRDVASLMRLPGIGRYTAGAIASIAYDTRAPLVDGNVIRVLMRLMAIDDDPGSPSVRARLWGLAEALLPSSRCGDYNQGLMELGATVCRPAGPLCDVCPVKSFCQARSRGLEDRIPRAARRATAKQAAFVVAAVQRGGSMLFVQRPAQGLWAGLWELPSEELQRGESLDAARERLRMRLPKGSRLSRGAKHEVRRELTHRRVIFHVLTGTVCGGGRDASGRWLRPDTLGSVGLSSACRSILDALAWTA